MGDFLPLILLGSDLEWQAASFIDEQSEDERTWQPEQREVANHVGKAAERTNQSSDHRLREHREDIPDLVQSLIADMNSKHGRRVAAVSEAVLNSFQNYSWPGNVRELRNTLERAVIVCDGAVVETRHLPPGFGQTPVRTSADDPDAVRLGVGTTVEEAEKMLILKTLEATSNNKTRAAEILGISLKTLHNKLKEYGNAGADASLAREEQ